MFPNIKVYAGQDNRVPIPKEEFIIFNFISKTRLSTNRRTYTDTPTTQTQNTWNPTEIVFQVDFYGKNAGERVHIFSTLFYDFNGFDSFPKEIKPLFCTDPSQMPLTNGSKEYEERWRTDVHIQYNAVVRSAMQFFNQAEVVTEPPTNFIEDKQ